MDDNNQKELSSEVTVLIWMIIALFLDFIVSCIVKVLIPSLDFGSIFIGGLFGLAALLAIGIFFEKRKR